MEKRLCPHCSLRSGYHYCRAVKDYIDTPPQKEIGGALTGAIVGTVVDGGVGLIAGLLLGSLFDD